MPEAAPSPLAAWESFYVILGSAAAVLDLTGGGGAAYTVVAGRRLRRPAGYRPVLEDWLWHIALPLVAYLLLVVLAIALPRLPAGALFGVGAVAVALLFIGLHNAWGIVPYVALQRLQGRARPRE